MESCAELPKTGIIEITAPPNLIGTVKIFVNTQPFKSDIIASKTKSLISFIKNSFHQIFKGWGVEA